MRSAIAMSALALSLGVVVASAAPTPPPERIDVTWSDPAKFSDSRENPGIDRYRPEEWLTELARHLRFRADRALPAGERLNVTFTDVDRAGTFEPWRGPRWDDVRIIKDFYPPRIDLHFSVTDADGGIVAEGDRTLRDPGFLNRSVGSSSDPLRYEKRLLDDWLRHEFRGTRKR
ncbi:MAG: DUF3016 domain-containing protein [Dokdonella sp.]